MKAGLTTSLVMHVAVLGFGLLTLSAPAPMQVADVEALPIDIVPIEEMTQVQQGDKAAPMTDRPAPEPTQRPDPVADAQTVGENSIDTETPPTPEPRPQPVRTAAVPKPSPLPVEKPDPQAKEEPKAEPEPAPTTEIAPVPLPKQEVRPDPVKKAEPTPEPVKEPVPEPEPVKEPTPEPEPVEEAEPAPKPEPKAAEKPAEQPKEQVKPDAVAETIVAEASEAEAVETNPVRLPDSAPAPAARPSPPQAQTAQTPERKAAEKPAAASASRPQSSEKEFNADEVAALLNKDKPSGGGAKRSRDQASLGGEKSTGGAKLSQSEMDALRGQVQKCWNIPAGAVDGDKLRVSVKFRLDRAGALDGSPEIISGGGSSGVERAAAEAARRAVARCAPYNLPADKYESWADVIVNFDPSEMY